MSPIFLFVLGIVLAIIGWALEASILITIGLVAAVVGGVIYVVQWLKVRA